MSKQTANIEDAKNQKRNSSNSLDEDVESCSNCQKWQAEFEKLKDEKMSDADEDKELQLLAKCFGGDETKPVNFSDLEQKIIESKMDTDNRLKNFADENRKLNEKAKILDNERDNLRKQFDHEIQSREWSDLQIRKLEETFEKANSEKAALEHALEVEVSKSKVYIAEFESLKRNASGDDVLIKDLYEIIKRQHNLINNIIKNQQTLTSRLKCLVETREKRQSDYSKMAPKIGQTGSNIRQISSPSPTKRVSVREPPPTNVRRTLLLDGPPSQEKHSCDDPEIMDTTPSTPARNSEATVRRAKTPVLSRTAPYALTPFSPVGQSETAVVPANRICSTDPILKKFVGNLLSNPTPSVNMSETVGGFAMNLRSRSTLTPESVQKLYLNDAEKSAKKAAPKIVVPGEKAKRSVLEKSDRLLQEKEEILKTFEAITSPHGKK